MEQVGEAQIVDVGLVAEHEIGGLVADPRGPDATDRFGCGALALRQILDGVHDPHIPGAAAQVGPEPALDGLAIQRCALGIDQRLGPHHDPGDAVAALERSMRRKRLGVAPPFFGIDPFERGDRLPLRLLQGDLAAHGGLAVEQDGASPALPRRRAPVLRRQDTQFLAQGGEEVRVVSPDLAGRAVHGDRGDIPSQSRAA